MTDARVSVRYEEHVAHVRLERADKRNAVDQAMIDAIIAAGAEVSASSARVCVLSAAGRAFCAGIDFGGLGAMLAQDPKALLMPRTHGNGTTNQWQEVAMVWARLPIPVIAAVQGPCFGAGMQLALGADIRIAAPDAQFAVMELKWGIVPDMGGMVLLPRLVRSDVLRLLTYTAEPVSAAQAEAWGLVTEVAEDPLARARALAQTLAQKSPAAIRAAKALIGYAEAEGAENVLQEESRVQASLMGTQEQLEVVAAQMQKRPPRFED